MTIRLFDLSGADILAPMPADAPQRPGARPAPPVRTLPMGAWAKERRAAARAFLASEPERRTAVASARLTAKGQRTATVWLAGADGKIRARAALEGMATGPRDEIRALLEDRLAGDGPAGQARSELLGALRERFGKSPAAREFDRLAAGRRTAALLLLGPAEPVEPTDVPIGDWDGAPALLDAGASRKLRATAERRPKCTSR